MELECETHLELCQYIGNITTSLFLGIFEDFHSEHFHHLISPLSGGGIPEEVNVLIREKFYCIIDTCVDPAFTRN